MTIYYYDRQGKVIPDGIHGLGRLAVDPEYTDLHETVVGGIIVLTRWVGIDMNIPIASYLRDNPNPRPVIFETIIWPPLQAMTWFHRMWGIYSDRFVHESQAAGRHALALEWLRDQLELRA